MNASAGLVLTLNAGSSSLKYAVFDAADPSRRISTGKVERIGEGAPGGGGGHADALRDVFERLGPVGGLAGVRAVGHRVVHGGEALVRSTRVTPAVMDALRRVRPLDPDHMPAEIAIIETVERLAPTTPQVACFDTAFHATMAPEARLLAIPRRYAAAGLRRYGFHGLSYTYLMQELARVAGEGAARGRVILAHLGAGASLAAVRDGRCVDTTMSFTPNSGVPMATRAGDLDPGVLVYLARNEGLNADALDHLLSRDSGLLGVSETSADMRDLLQRATDDPRAADAVALFCWYVRKAIGALATTIGGIDTLVFAGGIGENAPPVRSRVTSGLEHLGVHVDLARNAAGAAVVSTDGSPCTVRVIRTDEESVIARETMGVLERNEP